MSLLLKAIVFVFLSNFFSVNASESTTGNSIWTAVIRAEELRSKYGADHVLFASDLDNTLLKTDQDLASEPWFNWQDQLLKEKSESEKRIACDVADLLHFFYTAIGISRLSPVEDNQHLALLRLQALGIPSIIVTARGEPVASQTFRELSRNKLDFSITSPGGTGYSLPYLPYDLNDLSGSGLTEKDIEMFKLGAARNVFYQRGVLFSDGQNKGILIKTLIHKTKKNIKGIVFFDNDEKNTNQVFETFKNGNVEVITIRASRQDPDIQRFRTSDKEAVTGDFRILRKLLDSVYHYPRPCVLPMDKIKN